MHYEGDINNKIKNDHIQNNILKSVTTGERTIIKICFAGCVQLFALVKCYQQVTLCDKLIYRIIIQQNSWFFVSSQCTFQFYFGLLNLTTAKIWTNIELMLVRVSITILKYVLNRYYSIIQEWVDLFVVLSIDILQSWCFSFTFLVNFL